jgi:hypothetical protein
MLHGAFVAPDQPPAVVPPATASFDRAVRASIRPALHRPPARREVPIPAWARLGEQGGNDGPVRRSKVMSAQVHSLAWPARILKWLVGSTRHNESRYSRVFVKSKTLASVQAKMLCDGYPASAFASDFTTPLAYSSAIALSLKPTSISTSRVCSPSSGVGRPGRTSVWPNRI